MTDDHGFQQVIDELEESSVMTEAVYELENLKHVYNGETYNRVMAEVYDDNYDAAREILREAKQDEEDNR